MQLTVDEKAAVRAGKPVRVREDDVDCVLVRADVFDRFEASVVGGEEFDVTAAYPLVSAAMADDDAQDPLLDSYESILVPHRDKVPVCTVPRRSNAASW